MKHIDILTTARADYSLVLPVARAIERQEGLAGRLVYTGSHFSTNERPMLDTLISQAGLPTITVPCTGIGEGEYASAVALGEMTAGFASLWREQRPDMVLVLGDRYELLPAVSIAILYGIPIAHLFGGEGDVSFALDTQVRNALTKSAHIHFVNHEANRQLLMKLGEESWRIVACGNPALDFEVTADRDTFLRYAAEQDWGSGPFIAACYLPPTTLRHLWPGELEALLAALDEWPQHQIIWAGVNTDPGAREIQQRLEAHCQTRPNHVFVSGLGTARFYSLLQCAAVIVGNSSSGLMEASSFGLPAVNVGVRQVSRLCADNVINVPGETAAISAALHQAINDESFRAYVRGLKNPFQTGHAAHSIAEHVCRILHSHTRQQLMVKRLLPENPARFGGLNRVPEISVGD